MSNVELGMLLFSNGSIGEHETPRFVTAGLVEIAEVIADVRGEDRYRHGTLVDNCGCDSWESETFAMRTYCWCDGDRDGHEEACPPNFEHYASGFTATWYKHAERGQTQNLNVTRDEWAAILADCLASLHPTTTDTSPSDGAREETA